MIIIAQCVKCSFVGVNSYIVIFSIKGVLYGHTIKFVEAKVCCKVEINLFYKVFLNFISIKDNTAMCHLLKIKYICN